jgi:predicted Rossmann fold nucleotide-binding protein DprA/Smf involved in DNA uptake
VTTISPDTQAALLLCGHLERGRQSTDPLTPSEYNLLAAWLVDHGMRPSDLLRREGTSRLQALSPAVTKERLRHLLDRGLALAMASEEWDQRGLWVIGRSDAAYPAGLRKLKRSAPPLLYGAGDMELFKKPGLGIVGSRDADEEALVFTSRLGGRCAEEGIAVVSGGARGVDQAATDGVVEAGGTSVVVLAEGLTKPAATRSYRELIADGRLLLVSPFHPGARWTAGNAMGRNKVVYCLSGWVVVVVSGTEGGTWAGATENLKHGWVPLFVRSGADVPEGNERLLKRGALGIDEEMIRAGNLATALDRARPDAVAGTAQADLFSAGETDGGPVSEASGTPAARPGDSPRVLPDTPADAGDPPDILAVVWPYLAPRFREEVRAADLKTVAAELGLKDGQFRAWIDAAVERGLLRQEERPLRYRLSEGEKLL